MNARAVMDKHPTILRPTDTIKTATEFIMANRYRNIPVIDSDGKFLAVFGVNCLLRLVLPKAALMDKGLDNLSFVYESLHDMHERLREYEDEPISICMKQDAPVVEPETPLMEVLWLLYNTKTSIAVVEPETDRLVGMISYWDVGAKILDA